jgi:cytoskeleton protein RodZ
MTEQLSIVDEAHSRAAATPGELKALREAAGLSIPGTAAQLRLAPRQVEALELGEWDKLPGIAFIKGALRSYGRLLSADLSPLIAFVDQQLGQNELKADRTLDRKLPETSSLGFGEGGKGSKWVWLGLGLVGLAALALFFGQGLDSFVPKQFIPPPKTMDLGRDPASSDHLAKAAAASAGNSPQAPVPAAGATPGTGSTATVPPAASSSAGKPSTDPMSVAANTSSAPSAAPSASTGAPDPSKGEVANKSGGSVAGAGEVQFQISFAKDSWVEIKDATGERVLYGTQVAGTNQMLRGKAPYSAIIGNAIHVKIEKKDGTLASGASEQVLPMPKEMPQGIARLKIQ